MYSTWYQVGILTMRRCRQHIHSYKRHSVCLCPWAAILQSVDLLKRRKCKVLLRHNSSLGAITCHASHGRCLWIHSARVWEGLSWLEDIQSRGSDAVELLKKKLTLNHPTQIISHVFLFSSLDYGSVTTARAFEKGIWSASGEQLLGAYKPTRLCVEKHTLRI